MKKFVQILEDYVQWVALGLGVLWIGYIVWSYVVNVPTVSIAPSTTPLTAGQVDDAIKHDHLQPLLDAMDSTDPVPWPVPNKSDSLVDRFLPQPPPPTSSTVWVQAPPQPSADDLVQRGGNATQPAAQRLAVSKTPAVPAVVLSAPATVVGRSSLAIPSMPKADTDADWVAVSGTIPMAQLAASWDNAFKNTQLQVPSTYFLQVTLTRQEKINGNWVSETSALLLPGQAPIAQLPPFPADNNPQAQRAYRGEVQTQGAALTTPQFYKVDNGDPWISAVPGPGGAMAPQPGAPPRALPPGAAPAAAPAAASPGGALPPGLQPGPFVPAAALPDIPIVLHDESTKPEHTYRYRITYKLYNPGFDQNPAFVDPKIAAIFHLDSPPSDWTNAVTIPPRTYVFLKSLARVGAGLSAKFDVFAWTDGALRSKSFTVSVGDEIGDATFVTNRTLIDASDISQTALVANDTDGSVATHSKVADTDPAIKKLKDDAAKTAPAGASAN